MDKQRIRRLASMPYDEYLQTPEWQAKRQMALDRDKGCRLCDTQERLEVHHRTYARRGNEDLNDLTTLCESCHEHFHTRKRQEEMQDWMYSSPERKERSKFAWEEHLIGLLIQHPSLLPSVQDIMGEGDFLGTDTGELYHLVIASPSLLPLNEGVPAHLRETAERCLKSVESISAINEAGLVKEAVQCAVRLKWERVKQTQSELTSRIDEAAKSGNDALVRELALQLAEGGKMMRTLLRMRP